MASPPPLTPGPPPPRPYRLSARLLAVDPHGRVLLVPVHDVEAAWWDLPGGGVEPGESVVAAAVRETLEETGYAIPPESVGPVVWSGEVTFRWLGRWHWSRQVVHLARVADLAAPVTPVLMPEEADTHGTARWWDLAAADAAGVEVPPVGPATALRPLLAGQHVHDARVVWRPGPAP